MASKQEAYVPYFNTTEKTIIYSALTEAAEYLSEFYCFSPREWFNHCYDLRTELELNHGNCNKNAFAEVMQYTPALKELSPFPKERYQICLFDRKILKTLWRYPDLEFYPFMIYILTHELVHIARFCQDFHPFECDEESLQREEEKVTRLTQQVLDVKKSESLSKISSFYSSIGSPTSFPPSPSLC
jgi:hypothetical protein